MLERTVAGIETISSLTQRMARAGRFPRDQAAAVIAGLERIERAAHAAAAAVKEV